MAVKVLIVHGENVSYVKKDKIFYNCLVEYYNNRCSCFDEILCLAAKMFLNTTI